MSYAGLISNELLVYLKPHSTPPYKTVQCAKWLISQGKFDNIDNALDYIINLELNNRGAFKHLMSEFYRNTDYKGRYYVFNEKANNITTNEDCYGQELHMFY